MDHAVVVLSAKEQIIMQKTVGKILIAVILEAVVPVAVAVVVVVVIIIFVEIIIFVVDAVELEFGAASTEQARDACVQHAGFST